MAGSLQNGSRMSSGSTWLGSKSTKWLLGGCSSVRFTESKSVDVPQLMKSEFKGKQQQQQQQQQQIVVSDQTGLNDWISKGSATLSVAKAAQGSSIWCVSRALRWWEKTLKPNMIEIGSAQELLESLKNAGDRLVIIDFYSPGCGGCKALHPKICHVAEMNPNALFLQVNYEDLKTMCYSLNIHVLPFFRFYRGAEGRLSSFSCTNATIKKFKDALAKHGTERCSLGPAKGLEESELRVLAANGQISLDYLSSSDNKGIMEDLIREEERDKSNSFSRKAGGNVASSVL